MKSRWTQLACWERRANFIGHILHTESELMNRHTREMFSPSWAYRVGILYHTLFVQIRRMRHKRVMCWWRLGEKWVAESGFQAGRQAGSWGHVLNHCTVLLLWTLLITVLHACLLCTPGSAPGTLYLCLSLLAPHDNWITDEGSSQKASGQYADTGRLAPKPDWPLLHPVSLKTQEGSDLYETCKRFQREKTGKACRRRWTVQSSSF